MSRYVRDTTEHKIFMKIFMVIFLLGASVSGSLILSHPANALSLPLVNNVTNLLQQVLPSAPSRSPIVSNPITAPITDTIVSSDSPFRRSAPAQTPPAVQSQSSSRPGHSATSPLDVTIPTTPIAMTITPLDVNWQKHSKSGASTLASVRSIGSPSISSSGYFSLLQPSEQG